VAVLRHQPLAALTLPEVRAALQELIHQPTTMA
jgi:hypothetical protein